MFYKTMKPEDIFCTYGMSSKLLRTFYNAGADLTDVVTIDLALRKLRRNVETIEAGLAEIEKQIAAYDAKFAAATEYNEADYKAYNELKTRYDHQMHEWEKASYELEIIENE